MWRVAVTGVGAAVAMPVFSSTTAVFGREDANVTAKAVVLTIEIAALWVADRTFHGPRSFASPWPPAAGAAQTPVARVGAHA